MPRVLRFIDARVLPHGWKDLLRQILLFAGAFLVALVILIANLRLAARFSPPPPPGAERPSVRDVFERLSQTGSWSIEAAASG